MLDTHSVERQRWEDPSVNHRRPSCSSPVAIGGARPRFCTTLHISPVNARTIVDTSATFILIVSECLHAECLNANADWCRCRQGREKAIMQRRRQQPRVLAWAEAWLFVDTQCASASSRLPRNKVNTSSRLSVYVFLFSFVYCVLVFQALGDSESIWVLLQMYAPLNNRSTDDVQLTTYSSSRKQYLCPNYPSVSSRRR